jgi:hypothetical protein
MCISAFVDISAAKFVGLELLVVHRSLVTDHGSYGILGSCAAAA